MLEYLTEFVAIDSDEEMTRRLNVRAADGWGISRFEAEQNHVKHSLDGTDEHHIHKNVPGYRVVWCRNLDPSMEPGGHQHAHVQLQAVPFGQLPPQVQQMLASMGMGPPGPPGGYQPKPHKDK